MLTALGTLLGGVGIFLLGMHHLTEGLKQSAGEKLDFYLNLWTNTKKRGFASGFFLTALVQSSSVLTVATIGFVNAGILAMGQAVWVVFGSNVGTTMTAWIVALVGFKFKVELFALPLVGIGAFFNIMASSTKWRAMGGALVGFGLIFVGLSFLQSSLEAYKGNFALVEASAFDLSHVLLLLGIGFLLTVVMQSSSASMAMILTLVNAQVIPLELGAAAVIGANIGTTSTAVLATIGATPNAKRVAWAHVIFNVVAGLVALLMLPLVSEVFAKAYERQLMGGNAAFWLAIYHTLFNILGVMIMIPLEPRMTRFLEQQFQSKESQRYRLKFLDKNSLSVPSIALQSIASEMQNLQQLSAKAIVTEVAAVAPKDQCKEELDAVLALLHQFDQNVILTLQQPMAGVSADAFSKTIKFSQSLNNALQLTVGGLAHDKKPRHHLLNQILKEFDQSYEIYLTSIAGQSEESVVNDNLKHVLEMADLINLELFKALKDEHVSGQELNLAVQWVTRRRRIAQQMAKVLQRSAELIDAVRPSKQDATAEVLEMAANASDQP